MIQTYDSDICYRLTSIRNIGTGYTHKTEVYDTSIEYMPAYDAGSRGTGLRCGPIIQSHNTGIGHKHMIMVYETFIL